MLYFLINATSNTIIEWQIKTIIFSTNVVQRAINRSRQQSLFTYVNHLGYYFKYKYHPATW